MAPPPQQHPVPTSSSTKPPLNDEESQPFVPLYDGRPPLLFTFLYPRGWYQHTIMYLLVLLSFCLLAAEIAGITYLVKING
ncbi:hypothetical protein VE00_02398 [Pseudogymnoascus sp. WSF 3629]|nr:hypothetical protein VE00_02398 [Pseudogymnoascus sp. WSF 3629]